MKKLIIALLLIGTIFIAGCNYDVRHHVPDYIQDMIDAMVRQAETRPASTFSSPICSGRVCIE